MRISRNLLVVASVLLFFGGSIARAGGTNRKDLGASGHGPGPNATSGAVSFATCASSTNTENCQAFASSSSPTQFALNENGGAGNEEVLDVFTVSNSIVAGDLLTLNLNNINEAYGIFACNNGTGSPIDSEGQPL